VSGRIAALPPGEELTDPASFAELFSRSAAPAPSAFASLLPAPARLEAEIDGCASRSEAARLAVRLARVYCAAAVVFHVRRGVVYGIAAEGCSGRPEAALFPKAMPSAFSSVIARGETFRGAPPDRTLERRVLRALGREGAREMAVLPCAVGSRIAGLLYADGGSEPLGDAALAALADVSRRLGRTCERLVLARKLAA
jgi:hypothetical protein